MKFSLLHIFQFVIMNLLFQHIAVAETEDAEAAEIALGERLFLENRFAQAYYANPGKSDPVMDKTITTTVALASPFAGKTISCRACHMVGEHKDSVSAGMRNYTDFAQRPPVPRRNDGITTSGRNSMSMVNISLPHQTQKNAVFHFDGEFNSMEDLVRGTLTGRNFGWLAHEQCLAIKHIANVIRSDNGKGEVAQEFGGSYRNVLRGLDKNMDARFLLPAEYRINVDSASDRQILDAVAKLISAYVTELAYAKDNNGRYTSTPYDAFLRKNNLPAQPDKNESLTNYNTRLLNEVERLTNPVYVSGKNTTFKTHQQKFVFAESELQGMKVFFRKAKQNQSGGNCASCHTAPHFSDFGFHNTGLAQQNYDELHATGAFMKLQIPGLKKRNGNHNAFLPVTAKHPEATSRFRSIAAKNKPGYTDLGLWNVFANPDMPAPQQKLKTIMCFQSQMKNKNQCASDRLLASTVAAFKTPVLRDLGHSAPYMHTGQFTDLRQVIRFYITSSTLAKNKTLRNAEKNIENMLVSEKDVEPLVAFVKSLNEDYD